MSSRGLPISKLAVGFHADTSPQRRVSLMQFGIGILGKNYDPAAALARLLVDERPARKNFPAHAECHAAKLAAETLLSEPPTIPDLSDDALIRRFAKCALSVHRSEVAMVRDAFIRTYAQAVERAG